MEEFYAIGGEEYFSNGICIIEWGEIIKEALPKDYLSLKFSKMEENDNKRVIDITTYGERFNLLDFEEILN